MRIDVDRFVLLATTGKNAKNKPFLTAVRQSKFPLVNPSFDLLTVNCKLSVGFNWIAPLLVNCQLSIVNSKNNELFIHLRIGV
jgi:hypothetical protein